MVKKKITKKVSKSKLSPKNKTRRNSDTGYIVKR